MSTEREGFDYRQAFEAGVLQERERLAWQQQVLEAEADIFSGRACIKEQEAGTGLHGTNRPWATYVTTQSSSLAASLIF